MFSKKFSLWSYDRQKIWLYAVYLIVALLISKQLDIIDYLVAQWISLEFVTGWVAWIIYILKQYLKDNSMEDPLHIMDWSKEWDYDEDDVFLEWESELLKKLKKVPAVDNIRISYSQYYNPETKSACTLFSPLWVISSMFNITLTWDQIMEARWYAVANFWYEQWQWAYFETGVRCICKRWNLTFPNNQVMYFKSTLDSSEVRLVLEKGYGVCWGYKGNTKYNADRLDGKLDGIDFWPTTYGHATSVHLIDLVYWCYDSMPKMMKYIFGHNPADIKWWYRNCYVILPVKEIPKETSKKIQEIRKKRGLDPFKVK